MKPLHPFSALRGVTLTEVMIVIAIIGILAGIAVPSYQDMIERNRLKQAVESLANDMKFARTEAIKRSCDVTLSVTSSSYTISTVANSGGCSASITLRTVANSQLNNAGFSNLHAVRFSFTRGTTTSETNLENTVKVSGKSAVVVAEPAGRVYICSDDGIMGYPGC